MRASFVCYRKVDPIHWQSLLYSLSNVDELLHEFDFSKMRELPCFAFDLLRTQRSLKVLEKNGRNVSQIVDYVSWFQQENLGMVYLFFPSFERLLISLKAIVVRV